LTTIKAGRLVARQTLHMTSPARTLAELSVPRYTSYPTAPHFSAAVGADDYGSWLAALSADATLSLYLHVPFCAQLCHYCGCHTKAVRRREPVDAYVGQLGAEIALVGARTGARKVVHLHWGGGTPSMIGPAAIAALTARLAQVFEVAAECEHGIELDPRYVTPELARSLAGLGVTRASLGVQDVSAHVQHAIGRIQPFAVVERAVRELREAGIGSISFDLMYGLPGQTVSDVRRSAALAASLEPQRLAYFGYAHVPWFKPHQRLINEVMLPRAVERLAQAEAAREVLAAVGYVAIGLDHFARPDDALAAAARAGRLRRNFQGYTTDQADTLIGLGASAISRFPQGFVQNAPDAGGYARAVASGRLATVRGIAISADDRMRARIIERLMCDFTVDLDVAGDEAPSSGFAAELAALAPLAAEGLVHLDGRRIAMTAKGRPFVRLAAAAFDAFLTSARIRHSAAV
jgi:oxygen-independent coproporphyrinogen-3 oxidase